MEVNVALQTFTAQCSYWNEEHQDWRDDGCMVSNKNKYIYTHTYKMTRFASHKAKLKLAIMMHYCNND